jgi:carbon starvation protein
MVGCWGYFLYIGVIDPNGGVNILWPMFGIANQMLAAIALSVASGILIKAQRPRYALVTLLPLAWLALVTTSAAWQKVMSPDPRIGLFAAADDLARQFAAGALDAARAAVAPQLIFNQRLDGWLTVLFTAILWFVIVDSLRVCLRRWRGLPLRAGSEAPYRASRLAAAGVRA